MLEAEQPRGKHVPCPTGHGGPGRRHREDRQFGNMRTLASLGGVSLQGEAGAWGGLEGASFQEETWGSAILIPPPLKTSVCGRRIRSVLSPESQKTKSKAGLTAT